MFIQIIDDPQASFTFRPKDPDSGQVSETEFTLRLVPDEVQKSLRKQTESVEWRRGQRVVTNDDARWADLCVSYAITGWKHLYSVTVRDGKTVARTLVPCEDKYKALLPEHVRIEIVRLCVGKEAGNRLEDPDAPSTTTAREADAATEGAAADPLRR